MQTTTQQARDQIQKNAEQKTMQDGMAFREGPAPQFPDGLTIGEIVDVKGVPCLLEYVNSGKRRLSFIPLHHGTRVPQPAKQKARLAVEKKR